MDRNGYNDSLFVTEHGKCYICHRHIDTARHEVLHGPNRQLSKKYGLWINVCPSCHTRVHAEDNGRYRYLKELAQIKFEVVYPEKDFLTIFGRRYI